MSIRITCDSCGRRLRIPDKWAGRKIMCPNCDEVVRIPLPVQAPRAPATSMPVAHTLTAGLEEAKAISSKLALASLILGLVSIMVLCIPFVGYVAIPFSTLGILLSLSGLVVALVRHEGGTGSLLAGTFTCLLALVLALLPHLLRGTQ